jgi:hypothetical protein
MPYATVIVGATPIKSRFSTGGAIYLTKEF